MTDIEELSNDRLTISYRRGWFGKIVNLGAAAAALAFAVGILFWGAGEVSTAEYPAFAAPFLVIMEIISLAAAFLLFSQVFDRISYKFDKTADAFVVKNQRFLFKRQTTSGMISEITGVSYEISGVDENTSSEIYLKFRPYGTTVETVKCGTRNISEDNHIADTIERFLKRENKN